MPINYGPYTFPTQGDSSNNDWTFTSPGSLTGISNRGTNRRWCWTGSGTPSSGVGPDSGQSDATFMYTEMTSTGQLGDVFSMEFSPEMQAAPYQWQLQFYWAMRTDNSNSESILSVEVFNDLDAWETIWTGVSANDGEARNGSTVWNLVDLDLTALIASEGVSTGADVQFRILVTIPSSGTTWHYDIGIDSLSITGTEAGAGAEVPAGNISFTGHAPTIPDAVAQIAAPTYVGSGAMATTTGTSVSPALPAGVQEHDLLLAIVETYEQAAALTTTGSAGWAVLQDYNAYPTGARWSSGTTLDTFQVLWKFAGASEPTPQFDNVNAVSHMSAVVTAFRGINTSTLRPFLYNERNPTRNTGILQFGGTSQEEYVYPEVYVPPGNFVSVFFGKKAGVQDAPMVSYNCPGGAITSGFSEDHSVGTQSGASLHMGYHIGGDTMLQVLGTATGSGTWQSTQSIVLIPAQTELSYDQPDVNSPALNPIPTLFSYDYANSTGSWSTLGSFGVNHTFGYLQVMHIVGTGPTAGQFNNNEQLSWNALGSVSEQGSGTSSQNVVVDAYWRFSDNTSLDLVQIAPAVGSNYVVGIMSYFQNVDPITPMENWNGLGNSFGEGTVVDSATATVGVDMQQPSRNKAMHYTMLGLGGNTKPPATQGTHPSLPNTESYGPYYSYTSGDGGTAGSMSWFQETGGTEETVQFSSDGGHGQQETACVAALDIALYGVADPDPQDIEVPAGNVSFTGHPPTFIEEVADVDIEVPTGSMSITGYVPDVGPIVEPGLQTIAFTGYEPVVFVGNNILNKPGAGSIGFAGVPPEPLVPAYPPGVNVEVSTYPPTRAGPPSVPIELVPAVQMSGSFAPATRSIPFTIQEDDLMVLVIFCRSSYTITTPTDWTRQGDGYNSGARMAVFYKFYEAGDSNPSIALSSSGQPFVGGITAYRNVDKSQPFDEFDIFNGDANRPMRSFNFPVMGMRGREPGSRFISAVGSRVADSAFSQTRFHDDTFGDWEGNANFVYTSPSGTFNDMNFYWLDRQLDAAEEYSGMYVYRMTNASYFQNPVHFSALLRPANSRLYANVPPPPQFQNLEKNVASTTSQQYECPTNTDDGDLLLLSVHSFNNGQTVFPTLAVGDAPNWTQLFQESQGDYTLTVWWKKKDGTSDDPTVEITGGNEFSAMISAWKHANDNEGLLSPIIGYNIYKTSSEMQPRIESGALNTPSPGTLAVGICAHFDGTTFNMSSFFWNDSNASVKYTGAASSTDGDPWGATNLQQSLVWGEVDGSNAGYWEYTGGFNVDNQVAAMIYIRPFQLGIEGVAQVATRVVEISSYPPLLGWYEQTIPTATIEVDTAIPRIGPFIFDRPKVIDSGANLGGNYKVLGTSVPYVWDDADRMEIDHSAATSNTLQPRGQMRVGAPSFTMSEYPDEGLARFQTGTLFKAKLDDYGPLWQNNDPLDPVDPKFVQQGMPYGFSDYTSLGGDGVNRWHALAAMNHVDNSSDQDYDWTNLLWGSTISLAETIDVGQVPWYSVRDEDRSWPSYFYGRDVDNELGYLIGMRQQGIYRLPCLYTWSGAQTWDAGTDICGTGEEAVAFETDLIGWCRALQSDPDKIYVLCTTKRQDNGAHLNFKIFAVDCNTKSITRIVNESVSFGNGTWYYIEGYGDGYDDLWHIAGSTVEALSQGTTRDEERCRPIILDSGSYFIFRVNDTAGDRFYLELELNNGNWLSPSYEIRDANLDPLDLPTPAPDGTAFSPDKFYLAQWLMHGIVWANKEVYAVRVGIQASTEAAGHEWLGRWVVHFSWRAMFADTAWSPWEVINKRWAIPDATPTVEWMIQGANGGVRNWGQNVNGDPIGFGVHSHYVILDRSVPVLRGTDSRQWHIQWWLKGNDFEPEIAFNVSPTDYVTMDIGVAINAAGFMTATADVQISLEIDSTVIVDTRYLLEDNTQFNDKTADLEGQDSLQALFDPDAKYFGMYVTPENSSVVFGFDTIPSTATVSYYDTRHQYWGQTLHEEFLAILNPERERLGLAPFKLPTKEFFEVYPLNVAQIQSEQMRDTNVLAHDSPDFIPPYQTASERAALAGYKGVSENLIVRSPRTISVYFTVDNGVDLTRTYIDPFVESVGVGTPLNPDWYVSQATPRDLYQGWFDSPGHRGNMFFDWGEDRPDVYSLMGWSLPIFLYQQAIDDQYYGVQRTFEGSYLYVTNKFADVTVATETQTRGFYYDFEGAAISMWDLNHSVSAYVDVREQNELTYSIRTGVTLECPYEQIIAVDCIFPITYNVRTQTEFPYGPTYNVANDFSFVWDSKNTQGVVKQDSVLKYGIRTGTLIELLWEPSAKAVQSLEFVYEPSSLVAQELDLRYSDTGRAAVEFEFPFQSAIRASGSLELPYSDTSRVGSDVILPYEQATLVLQETEFVYSSSTRSITAIAFNYQTANRPVVSHTFPYEDASRPATSFAFSYSSGDRTATQVEFPITGASVAANSTEFPYSSASRAAQELNLPWESAAKVAAQGEFAWSESTKLAAAIDFPYEGAATINAQFSFGYSSATRLSNQIVVPYELAARARSQHSFPYQQAARPAAQTEFAYENSRRVAVQSTIPYSDSIRVGSDTEFPFQQAIRVANDVVLEVGYAQFIKSDGEFVWSITTPVQNDYEFVWSVRAVTVVPTELRSYWSIMEGAIVQNIVNSSLTINGRDIEILDDIDITQSEGGPAWVAQVRVISEADYIGVAEGDTAVLTLTGAETWNLVVTQKSVQRSFEDESFVLKMESPVVELMSPRAERASYNYGTPMMAKDMVELIMGQSVTWNVADWTIPAGKVVLENSTPYDAAMAVIGTIGGIMLSDKDGSLRVQYLYPNAMHRLFDASVDHVFTDKDDNLSHSISYEERGGENFYRLIEGQSTFKDRLEWIADEDDPSTGILRVYLSPWRTDYALVYTGSTATFNKQGVVERSEKEVVEFTEGSAAMGYPVFNVDSVDWKSSSLGAVVHENSSNTLTSGIGVNEGYGLAEIEYRTKAVEYSVTGVLGDYAQFIVKSEE